MLRGWGEMGKSCRRFAPILLVGDFNWLCFMFSPIWDDDHSNHSRLILFQLGWSQQKKSYEMATKHDEITTWLVGGLEHVFFHILGISSSHTNSIIFQRGRAQPPTRWRFHVKPTGRKLDSQSGMDHCQGGCSQRPGCGVFLLGLYTLW